MKAIVVRYRGPTNTKGSRVIASAEDRSNGKALRISLPWDHALNFEENSDNAAKALKNKLGWKGEMVAGTLPCDGQVYVFVNGRKI